MESYVGPMLPLGTKIASIYSGNEGTVVGYGIIQWYPDEEIARAVYLVQTAEGSGHGVQACVVFSQDTIRKVE